MHDTEEIYVYNLRNQSWMTRSGTGTSDISSATVFYASSVRHLLRQKDHTGNPSYIPVRKSDMDDRD